MSELPPYVMRADHGCVEVWACYQIQFGEMRRFAWQDTLVREMKTQVPLRNCEGVIAWKISDRCGAARSYGIPQVCIVSGAGDDSVRHAGCRDPDADLVCRSTP